MPRFLTVSVLLAGVLLVIHPIASQSADKKAMALKFVKKGIEFLGGEANIKKYTGATYSEKGTYYGMGDGLPYTGKYSVEFPDKFRMEIQGVFVQVLNGDKGWTKMGDEVKDMTKDQVKALREQHYVGLVMQLYPLLKKKFSLEFIDDGRVDGQGVAFIKVSAKGHQDVTLAINPKTGELVKATYTGAMEGMPNKRVTYEAFNADYKTAGKIKYPSKVRITRDGKKFVEATITEYKPTKKVDESLLAKPK